MAQWQRQTGRTCGQTCIAILTERPLAEICTHVGHQHGTKTRELAAVLRHYGYETSDKLILYKNTIGLSPIAIVKVAWSRLDGRKFHGWHWVLWAEGRFWDPQNESARDITDILRYQYKDRITSYLQIWRVG